MANLQFDPVNKLIKILSPTTEIDALDIYSDAMDWADEIQNMSHDVPIQAVGKFALGGGIYSDIIFILVNGWKIKWYNGTYTGVVKGTLITEDESRRTVPPDTGSMEAVFAVASAGTISLVSSGSGLSQEEHDQLMGTALESTAQNIKTKTDTIVWTDVDFIKAIEGGRWRIIDNQMIFYGEDNVTEIARFNLFDAAEQPAETNVTERRRV